MMAPLDIQQLSHRYGETPVLAPLSLTLSPGELVCVLGPSGCGKTTLLRAIAGLVSPTTGTIRIGGQITNENGTSLVPIQQRSVGLVFQDYALFPTLTVHQNVGFGLRPADPSRVNQLIELVGLAGLEHRLPQQLSGGQQQRVALARALAPRPNLLLLDEPFANVDAARRHQLGQQLRHALAAEGRAGLLITHDCADALSLGDRVLVLSPTPQGGQLAMCATPQEVYARPVTAEVAALTGPVNILSPSQLASLGHTSQESTALLRPEHLRFEPGPGDCTVTHRAYTGRQWTLDVQSATGTIVQVLWLEQQAPTIGAIGRLTLCVQPHVV